ncbi:MAG: hypothetical protein V9H69_19760 [Anaerolineae bacterium]
MDIVSVGDRGKRRYDSCISNQGNGPWSGAGGYPHPGELECVGFGGQKQKVTGYVVDNVSDHMAGDDPTLVVDGDRFLWRVPVQLAVLPRGRLGQVGAIDVDAQSGQLLITNRLIEGLTTQCPGAC